MKVTSSSETFNTTYINGSLERKNYNVLKFTPFLSAILQ